MTLSSVFVLPSSRDITSQSFARPWGFPTVRLPPGADVGRLSTTAYSILMSFQTQKNYSTSTST